MRSIKSDLEYTRFPMKVGMPPSPVWRRRSPVPGPGSGTRLRRSDKVDADSLKRSDKVQSQSDKVDN